jgi:hypothetical protein
LLQNAAGYAILSVLKVGMGWSAAVGTGLVIARAEDGSWSAPSAIGLGSFGWGVQAGGEMTDLLLVLNNIETVKVRATLIVQSESKQCLQWAAAGSSACSFCSKSFVQSSVPTVRQLRTQHS